MVRRKVRMGEKVARLLVQGQMAEPGASGVQGRGVEDG
jgi:hypothetical protein